MFTETENIEYSRSIRLSMRVNDLQGLVNIWDVFNGGGAQNQFNQIAELLSEYVGSKISITASVDVPKFKEALEEASKILTNDYISFKTHFRISLYIFACKNLNLRGIFQVSLFLNVMVLSHIFF
jgi:hypothetical protein